MFACVVPAVWQLVTRELPFAGLHHGEVIHRVVTEDLRPGDGLCEGASPCFPFQEQTCFLEGLRAATTVMLCKPLHPVRAPGLRSRHLAYQLAGTLHLAGFSSTCCTCCFHTLAPFAGPWPADVEDTLPGYKALAEVCWARQAAKRPTAQQVLQTLLSMLAQAEATH